VRRVFSGILIDFNREHVCSSSRQINMFLFIFDGKGVTALAKTTGDNKLFLHLRIDMKEDWLSFNHNLDVLVRNKTIAFALFIIIHLKNHPTLKQT